MTYFIKKEEALKLRKEGMSYSQIKQKIGVSKSTLSGWLKEYPLSKERILELTSKSERRIEKYRETMRRKREERLQIVYEKEKKILPFDTREILIFGLGLYWGEGAKARGASLSMSNTDPSLIKFFIFWLIKSFSIAKENLKVNLQLYKDMDVEKEIYFWQNVLGLSRKQFNKPYIKESPLKAINHKGGFGHGTCNVYIGSVNLSERVLMAIKAVADKYALRT